MPELSASQYELKYGLGEMLALLLAPISDCQEVEVAADRRFTVMLSDFIESCWSRREFCDEGSVHLISLLVSV